MSKDSWDVLRVRQIYFAIKDRLWILGSRQCFRAVGVSLGRQYIQIFIMK